MKSLTVFTPSYNRAQTLPRTYKSLCNQTCKDFEWLIIDDGSSDNTKDLVKSWLVDGFTEDEKSLAGFSKDAPWLYMRYIFQDNQGMHGAHNTAYENINTELNTCIDSDDYMPYDAVENILMFWFSFPPSERNKYAGIIGLDLNASNNQIIGTTFPKGLKSTTTIDYYSNGGSGDKKLVYRTDIIKNTPSYPIFEGENYVGLNYKYILIDQNYELLTLNQPLVVVEYQQDGSSATMYRQYWKNPKGWSFYRKFEMEYCRSFKRLLKVCIHYNASSFIAKNKNFLKESPKKLITLLTLPAGYLFYRIIKNRVQK